MTEESEDQILTVAHRVAVYANAENRKFGIDPMTILAIVNIISTTIKIIYTCSKSRDVAKRAIKTPRTVQRFLVRRIVAKHFPKEERKAVYNSILEVSRKLSEKELDEVLDNYEQAMRTKR